MSFIIGLLYGGICGSWLGVAIFREVDRRIHRPYRWACPVKGCRFEVCGNDPGGVLRLSEIHKDHS